MHRGMLRLQASSTPSGWGRDAVVDEDGVSHELFFPDEHCGTQYRLNEILATSSFHITATAKAVVVSLLAEYEYRYWTV